VATKFILCFKGITGTSRFRNCVNLKALRMKMYELNGQFSAFCNQTVRIDRLLLQGGKWDVKAD